MFLVWKGLGLLAPLLAVIGFVVPVLIVDPRKDADPAEHTPMWAPGLGLTLAAIAIWFLGRYLNSSPPRHLVDANTGEDVFIHRTHSFFYVPFEYCALVVLPLGGLLIALDVFGAR